VGVNNLIGDDNAVGDTMHATHMVSPNTCCSPPDVWISRAEIGVEKLLSGWIFGCTTGTQVTDAS
jgi:hypothetical protein